VIAGIIFNRKATPPGGFSVFALDGRRRSVYPNSMLHLLLIWLISAVALIIVAYVVPGFELDGFGSALIAALVVGFLNATLGFLLKIITLPLSIVTLGIFFLVINAIILLIASAIVPGFRIRGFWAAFLGAVVLMLVRVVFRLAIHA
jgi:putative membrane protein